MAKPQTQQPANPPPGKEGPRDFLVFFHKLGAGEAQKVCSGELFEMGKRLKEEAQLQNTAVSGSLTITINFQADPEENRVKSTYEVKSKWPRPKRASTYMWITEGGNLTTAAPNSPQVNLPFADVANVRGIPNDLNDEELDLED